MTSDKYDYEVGYKKTPVHTRFKPGQSGNKGGRPKGSKNFKTDLAEVLGQSIELKINGKKQKVSKQRAYIMNVVAQALQSNQRAMTLLMNMYLKFMMEEEADKPDETLSETEQEILEEFIASVIADHTKKETPDE